MAFGTLKDLLSLEQAQGILFYNPSIPMEMGCSLTLPWHCQCYSNPRSTQSTVFAFQDFLASRSATQFHIHLFNVFSSHPHYKKKTTQKNPNLGKKKDKAHNEYAEFRGGDSEMKENSASTSWAPENISHNWYSQKPHFPGKQGTPPQ